jgi:hypothetical protein
MGFRMARNMTTTPWPVNALERAMEYIRSLLAADQS